MENTNEKIIVVITTYNRAEMLQKLIADIAAKKSDKNIEIVVYDDGSTQNYDACIALLEEHFNNKYSYLRAVKNGGKMLYYQAINTIFNYLRCEEFSYVIQVPDDVMLVDDFFNKCIKYFNHIPQRDRICLNISNDYSRNGKSFWTSVKVKDCGKLLHTGYVDMCYIANRKFFQLLDYQVNVNLHHASIPGNSSGVGMAISSVIINKGFHFYQVKKSLVLHGLHESVMHPDHRKQVPLISNHEFTQASVASVPEREKSLKDVVNSILPQVDRLNVYLNNYKYVPVFLRHPKIKVYQSQKHAGDLGDAGKFYNCDEWEGYCFTIDDDLIYPPDYVYKMIIDIEFYKRKALISAHGRKLRSWPVSSYYHGEFEAFSCLRAVNDRFFIQIPGTGVLAFHTDTVKPKMEWFKVSNMADIWFGLECQKLKVPISIIPHKVGWIVESRNFDSCNTIYNWCHRKDDIQRDAINSIEWHLNVL